MEFTQKSFVGGLNQQVDATRLADNEYPLLINGRNRYDLIAPINLPLELNDAAFPVNGKVQGIYAAGNILFVFKAGLAFYKNYDAPLSNFAQIPGFLMDPDVNTIYAELVSSSYLNFSRVPATADKNTAIRFVDNIGGSSQCLVVQDGKNQPWVVFNDFTARLTQTYAQWIIADPDDRREYVPIGKQMMYKDGILYIISPNGQQIYRSVTGRPLDFMVILDPTGNKLPNEAEGGASIISHSVDYDVITAINRLPTDDGSFFVSTNRASYVVRPEFGDNFLLFGEPDFTNTFLFSAGCVSPFSFVELIGDNAFVDFNGIRSFNAILQIKNEGRNSPFSKKIGPILQGILQDYTAATTFDNYALFAVNTIYGRAIIVYDTLSQTFVGLDIYPGVGQIKQFAEIKTTISRRLFFITVDNKIYEAFTGDIGLCQLYIGEWSSQDPSTEHKPWQLKLVFVDATEVGIVNATMYVDRKRIKLLGGAITKASAEATPLVVPFGASDTDKAEILVFDFMSTGLQGWKTGFLVEWASDVKLSHAKVAAIEETNINGVPNQAAMFKRTREILNNT